MNDKAGPVLERGDKVAVRFWVAQPVGLAGMQPKVGAREVTVIGKLVHIRGDHPTAPTATRGYVDVTDGELPPEVELVKPEGCTHAAGHLEIREEWIVAVEKDGVTYRVDR